MDEQNVKPIIFLAFANSGSPQLPQLSKEYHQLVEIVEHAKQKGYCDSVVRAYATVEDILKTFEQKEYRDHIAVFHYAGHADSSLLVLEGEDGAPALGDADGLAAFLSHQRGLRLVFLNGCSTQHQVQGLLDAGVDVVIATVGMIDDQMAAHFASHFYQYLADLDSIQTAFDKAREATRTAHTKDLRNFHVVNTGEAYSAHGWPWVIRHRPGADDAPQWKLKQDEDVDDETLEQLLRIFFKDDVAFNAFCRLKYPEIQGRFGEGMRHDQKLNLLLDHCSILPSRRLALFAQIRQQGFPEFDEVYQHIRKSS